MPKPERPLYRIRGRFASRSDWEAAQRLQRQADAERPKRRLGAHAQHVEFQRLPKRRVEARTEYQLRKLDDRQELPAPDGRAEFTDSFTGEKIYHYEWRYDGPSGEYLAHQTVRYLGLLSLNFSAYRDIKTRIVIFFGFGPNAPHPISSPTASPGDTLRWLETWDSKKYPQDSTLDVDKITFDVIATSTSPLPVTRMPHGKSQAKIPAKRSTRRNRPVRKKRVKRGKSNRGGRRDIKPKAPKSRKATKGRRRRNQSRNRKG